MLQRLGRVGAFIAALLSVMGLAWYITATTQARQAPPAVPAQPNISVKFLVVSPTPKPRPTGCACDPNPRLRQYLQHQNQLLPLSRKPPPLR